MDIRIVIPLITSTTALLSITTAVLLEQNGIEWMHAIWVALLVSLLVDFDLVKSPKNNRITSTIRKIAAVVFGLVVGIVTGLIIRAVDLWDCPVWIVEVIRIVGFTMIFFASSIACQRTTNKKFTSVHYTLLCTAATLPLFSTRASLAIARVAAVLLSCVFVLAAETIIYYLFLHDKPDRQPIKQADCDLIDKALSLATKAVRGDENDKEEIEKLAIGLSLKNDTSDRISTHVRPLVFECYSLYWSLVSSSATPFINHHSRLFSSPEMKPFLNRIEDGFDSLRNELVSLMESNTEYSVTVGRIIHESINRYLIEALQGLEFHFAHRQLPLRSPGERWTIACYLVNLGSLMVSTIGVVRALLMPLDEKLNADNLFTDSMGRIAEIQKLSSLSELLASTTPVTTRRPSLITSSQTVSPVISV
jgi:hypothetical protein